MRRLVRLLAMVVLATSTTWFVPTAATAAEDATQPAITRAPYPGDPESESGFVAAEDDRLIEVVTVDRLGGSSQVALRSPYRLATGSAYTLVLTARSAPYTLENLLALAPQTLVRRPDGSYLLSEHLVVLTGATLDLSRSGGLKLLLASDGDGFVSIVTSGGRLDIRGTKGAPVEIGSFDRHSESPDLETQDGRAYIRAVGGQVIIEDAELSNLGFWSGRTGGLSLTGTDRPNSGALDELGQTLQVGKQAERAKVVDDQASAKPATPAPGSNGQAARKGILPAGRLPVPVVDVDSPKYSYVSASINRTVVRGNAFGLFVSSAKGLDIRDSTFRESLVDGLVMHRFVTNAVIESTSSNDNAGDGIVLARATTGIVMSEIEASENSRNGLTMSGLPLASGPSATGITVGSYGNNSVSNSEMNGNRRYGVEVIGGVNIGVLANTVRDNDMGVVVREGAREVNVVGNRVTDSMRQGISLRDGVDEAVVTGNTVTGGETSIYARDSSPRVQRNTLTSASSHAVALVGTLTGTLLAQNTIAGRGPSAIDTKRAVDLDRDGWDNDLGAWEDTTPFLVTLKRFAQPLTLMWLVLGSLLVFTALRGANKRRHKVHPYADQARLTDATMTRTTTGAGL